MIRLRRCTEADFAALIAAVPTLPELVQWAGPASFQHPLTVGPFVRHLAQADGQPASPRIFTAVDTDGQAVGHAEIALIQLDHASASLCRVLVYPAHRGRGLCRPLVTEALRVGFEDIGLRRIDLRVYAFNQAAIRCYRQVGFVQEGMLRQSQKVGGELWDTVRMAILRQEWESSRQTNPAG